ncbi:MAG: amidohydrolase family protein [Planctomycetota bacterium]|nr:amidohydrolase family protein [Planctomycetota bacterium]
MKKNLLLFSLLSAVCVTSAHADLVAVRVGRAETVAKGVIEHAVIFVEDGKIVTIGEDLPIERGIPVVDKPEWTVMPGLVNCYSRLGADSEGGEDMSPDVKASDELWPQAEEYAEILKYGVTTLGIYPAGNGIPGLAVAVRTKAATKAEMILQDPAYLKVIVRADSSAKKRITDGFKKADEHDEKVKKAREKFDKDKEKKGSKKEEPKKDEPKKEEKPEEKKGVAQEPAVDDPKPDEKKDESKDGFVPPAADAKSKAFVDLRAKSLRALVCLNTAAEYLHWLDALGKEDILWDLRCVMSQDSDLFYVANKKEWDLDQDGIGDKKVHVVMEPRLTLTPGTMRTRNLALEFTNSGAKVVFIPRLDNVAEHKTWLAGVGEIVGAGLKRETALYAMTLGGAEVLGVEKRVGSLEKGKDANMVFLDGDPFEATTRIQAVMLDGKFVFGDVNQ